MNTNSASVRAAVVFSVATLSVATLAVLVRSHRKRTAKTRSPAHSTAAFVPDGCQKLMLEPNDIWAGLQTSMGMPVGTVTLFEGNNLAACEKHLKQKFKSIVKANPWMAGWTELDCDTPVMIHPTKESEELECIADSMVQVYSAPLLCGGPETESKQVSRFNLPYGRSTVGKPQTEAPLVRLVLMPCQQHESSKSAKSADIAVLFFTSHVLGGARTHYKLLGMLSTDQPVVALNAVRIPGVHERAVACLGQNPDVWLQTSINHIGSALCSLYFGRKPQLHKFMVCPERVAKLKASSEEVVSTNDIITSCMGRLVGARVMQMAVDMKRRPGFAIGDDCIGNYEINVLLDGSAISSPSALRRSLTTLSKRCADSDDVNGSKLHAPGHSTRAGGTSIEQNEPFAVLPAWWKFLFTRYAKITNWVAATEHLEVPGYKQAFHTPAADDPGRILRMSPYDIAVVFRFNPGQTGLVVVSRFSKEEYIKALPVVDFVDFDFD